MYIQNENTTLTMHTYLMAHIHWPRPNHRHVWWHGAPKSCDTNDAVGVSHGVDRGHVGQHHAVVTHHHSIGGSHVTRSTQTHRTPHTWGHAYWWRWPTQKTQWPTRPHQTHGILPYKRKE